MRQNNKEIEKYRDKRFSSEKDGNNGLFFVHRQSYTLKVIASDGMGWDHVSVSLPNRTPNWGEMCFIKDLFFDLSETVVQFHPKIEEYVNNHPHCLHLWRDQHNEHWLPPSNLTGLKELNLT